MRIRILCVGKLKEGYYQRACDDYRKRLQRFAAIEIVEVADEHAPESLSAAERQQVKRREGERLSKHLKDGLTVALCLEGKQEDSRAFAAKMAGYEQRGLSCVQLLIGGSLGLDHLLIEQADERLSLSAFTFPHNLARLVLLEQLYRAMKINRNEPYHK